VAANPKPKPPCGNCNLVSGENRCDITTSCINTGTSFHCACRAGYKASQNNNNVNQQFRLPMPNYKLLVFVPENTPCNTLCNNRMAPPNELCNEFRFTTSAPLSGWL
jgi:hypothetical protein